MENAVNSLTHICVGKLTIIGSDNDLSPVHRQAIIWNIINWRLGNKLQWNFIRNSNIFIQGMHIKMSSVKWRPFCLGLNVLNVIPLIHNSLWHCGVIWRRRSWSTFVQVMACCQTAPSHYLSQCWLIINTNLNVSTQDIKPRSAFKS